MSSRRSRMTWRRQARGAMAGIPVSAPGERMAALRAGWLAHTVKRAVAAVGSASDADYRAFGWDRNELLAQLHSLLEKTTRKQPSYRLPLTITVARPAGSKNRTDDLPGSA